MSEAKGKNQDQTPDGFMYAIAGVAVFGAVLWCLARLPFFAFGLMIGFMSIANFKSREGFLTQAKAFFGTLSVAYFLVYLGFGFSGIYGSDFAGILIKFELYQDFVISIIRSWNNFMPGYLKGMRVTDAMVTTGNISKLVVPSMILGTISSFILPPIFELIVKPKKKQELELKRQHHARPSMLSVAAEFVYLGFYYSFELPLTKLVKRGQFYAIKMREFNLKAIIHAFAALFLMVGMGAIIEKIPHYFGISSKELNVVFTIIAGLPFLSLLAGLLLGLIPSLGDTILFHLFESRPEGAKVLSTPKKERSGFLLGFRSKNKPYVLTERNLNHHIQIVAPSGGGKTNIIKNFIKDRIQKGHGILFLDYKADFEVAEFIYSISKEVGREDDMRVFSLSKRELSVPYNPISHGLASELESRLMNAFQWSEPYYRSKAESALLKLFRGLCELRDLGLIDITLKTVYDAFTKKGLVREWSQILKTQNGSQWDALEDLAQVLDRPSDAKDLQGLVTNLEKIIYSGAGELLTKDCAGRSFTIDEAFSKGRIAYFLMNSLSQKETANSIGKLLLQDLMGYVGRVYDQGASNQKPMTIIIDEFAEFAISEFPSFLNRVRGAGVGVMIAHQTRGDLKAISPDYQNKIEANTNTKIVAGVIDPMDAQFYAQLIGTQTVEKETHQVTENGGLLALGDTRTGMKSVREVEEFVIHPNRIKKIEQGEALVISRTVDSNYGLVWVPKAETSNIASTNEMRSELVKIRKLYFEQKSPGLIINATIPKSQTEEKPDIWA